MAMGTESQVEFPSGEPWLAWGMFLQAYKVIVEKLDRDLKDRSGLSLGEFQVLYLLTRAGGRLRFLDLSRAMILSQSRVSRQMNVLQERGYILREITPSNRRSTFAVLTDAGARVYQQAEPAFVDGFNRHFLAHIPASEMATFNKMMVRFLQEDPKWIDRAKVMSERVEMTREEIAFLALERSRYFG